ncbi:MAG: hypothetical protein WD030_06465, partial [Pirellulales bacterium]
ASGSASESACRPTRLRFELVLLALPPARPPDGESQRESDGHTGEEKNDAERELGLGDVG